MAGQIYDLESAYQKPNSAGEYIVLEELIQVLTNKYQNLVILEKEEAAILALLGLTVPD